MKTKNIEKKRVRRTEMNKLGESEDKEKGHSRPTHLFLGMRLIIICFMLLFAGVGVVSAQLDISYDSDTRTITIVSGTAYPQDIADVVDDPSVFGRTGNTSILTANLKINAGAGLVINGETWKFNCSSNGQYGITNWGGTLQIDSSTITSVTPGLRGWIINKENSIFILTNSTVSELGHGVLFESGIYLYNGVDYVNSKVEYNEIYNCYRGIEMGSDGSTSFSISHNKIHDVDANGIWKGKATIFNNTIYNVGTAVGQYQGAIVWTGGIIENNTIYNVTGAAGAGIRPKEHPDPIVRYNNVFDIDGTGIDLYYTYGLSGEMIAEGNILDNCGKGICMTGTVNTIAIIKNNTISNSGIGIWLRSSANATVYNNTVSGCVNGLYTHMYSGTATFTDDILSDNSYGLYFKSLSGNITFVNTEIYGSSTYDIYLIYTSTPPSFINTNYTNIAFHGGYFTEFRNYYYLDAHIIDLNSNPIDGATVNIINNVDSDYPSININGKNKTSFTTGADGHTPLPSDTENSIAILDYWQTKTEKKEMNYIITASDNGNSTTVTGINPNETWYRSDPNVPTHTVTIVLDTTALNITNVQVPLITSSGATINWTTNELSDSLVKYGTSPDGYTKNASNTSYVTSHRIALTGLTPNTIYYFVVNSTDPAGNSNQSIEHNFTTLHVIFGTITYTCNETGIAGVTINLTQNGNLVNSTTTDSSGNYTLTDVSSGDYNVNVSKIRFWSNSTSVTANAGETIANLMLWLKGDLNNNGTSADNEDLIWMKIACLGEITGDWKYNLNNNEINADIGDLVLLKRAKLGEIGLL